MSAARFIGAVVLSWGLVFLGLSVAGTLWLSVCVVLIAIIVFVVGSLSRGKSTGLRRTAKTAALCYMSCPVLMISGQLWMDFALRPPVVAILMVGAGVWCVGVAWTCAIALWNGSWYLRSRRQL